MNRPCGPVTIIVALADPTPGVEPRLTRFVEEAGPDGSVILVDASGQELGPIDGVRLIRQPSGRLTPQLWLDGLMATDRPLVAFTTANIMPRRGWLKAMLDRLNETGAAGVGGPIEPGPGLSSTDRSVSLLRYSRYFPPIGNRSDISPPGENAVYRRDRLLKVQASWADGFWESEVHRALLDRGESLAMAEDALVVFEGGVGLVPMVRQRWVHARRYGEGRSQGRTFLSRLVRGLAFPIVPVLLAARILANPRVRAIRPSPGISDWVRLALLSTSWSLGEAVGTVRGPSRRPVLANPLIRRSR